MHKRSRTRWNTIKDPHFGPLGAHVKEFEKVLSEQGYLQLYINCMIRMIYHLNKWLYQKQISLKQLNEKKVAVFLRYWLKSHRPCLVAQSTFTKLLDWLRRADIIPTPTPKKDKSRISCITEDYKRYLKDERGLSSETLRNYIPTVRRFLSWRFKLNTFALGDIRPKDVTKFLFNQTKNYSPKRIQLEASALRSFFRFLLFSGDINVDLASCVPTVANHQPSELPKYLHPKDVNRLLLGCNRTRAAGIRDYAILLLMARLGLRAGELLTLTLDDIKWEEGTIVIHGKSGQDETLPIPKDVGSAIVKYLKKSRPKCSTRRLFVRTKAPFRELARDGCICSVVRRACRRAGISPPHQGAHLLRHSLATHMLHKGATMNEIADILRHRSTQTTEIYAKVNMRALNELAQPWPTGAI